MQNIFVLIPKLRRITDTQAPWYLREKSTFIKIWFFSITHYDYYLLFNAFALIDLNIAKEIYFHINSFEFFLINFVVLYGILSSIFGLFLLKKI